MHISTVAALSAFIVLCVSSFVPCLNYAEAVTTSQPNTTQPNTTFTNVHVDTYPLPNKPFKISATMNAMAFNSNLIASITVPSGITLSSPLTINLPNTGYGTQRSATWILIAHSPGTFPVQITVYTDNPSETDTFNLDVVVGSPKSIIVTGITVPGNIVPDDNFTVGVKLKNTASITDENIISQISIPSGLQLLDNVSSTIASIDPNQEVELSWKLKAENVGSHLISINYTSANSGSNTVQLNVNVGSTSEPTGGLLSVTSRPATLLPNAITPILFDITNNGMEPIHNLQIVSASGGGYVSTNTPVWIGDLGNNSTKTVPLKIYPSNETLSLQIPIGVKYDTGSNQYSETYQVGLTLGNQPVFKINSVTVTPVISYAGDVGDKINVQLFNYGLGANDVYVTLRLPPGLSPSWGNSTSAYFGRINTFQTVSASFFVNVDNTISSKSYPLALLITTANQETTLNANFIVSPKAQFQLISEDDSQLYPGATNVPFKIIIKNTGTIAAQTITTTLLTGNSIPGVKSSAVTSVGNMENIGTVLPGQTFVTTFIVNLQPQFVPGDQSTSVQINWSQNYTSSSNGFVQTLIIPYHVAAGPYYLLYYDGIPVVYMIIGGLLTIGLVIFAIKRRKRLKLMELASLQNRVSSARSLESPDEVDEDISAEKNNESLMNKRILNKETLDKDGNGEERSSIGDKKINQM